MTVLHPLDLAIDAGEMVAIVGPPAPANRPDEPAGLPRSPERRPVSVSQPGYRDPGCPLLARLRCHHFGFIFQRYHLLPHLDAAANVEIRHLCRHCPP